MIVVQRINYTFQSHNVLHIEACTELRQSKSLCLSVMFVYQLGFMDLLILIV